MYSCNLLRRTEKSPLPPSRYIYIYISSLNFLLQNKKLHTHFLFKKLHQFPNSSSHHDLQPSSHFYSLIHHPSTSVISYLPSPKTCSFFFPSSPALDAPLPHPIPPINQLSSTNFTLAKTFPTPEVILSSLPSPIFSSHSPSPPPITFHKSSGAT